MKKLFLKQHKAFTLIETMVAISIFTLSILALMSVLADGIADTNYAKEKIIASYLGQEGIEYIRNMRDTAVLYNATSGGTGWIAFNNSVDSASCVTAGCYVNHGSLVVCSGGVCPNLTYDSATATYGYGGSVDSGFNRKIVISHPTGDETKISSTVSWKQGSGTPQITFSESLYNWVE